MKDCKYNLNFSQEVINKDITRLINQIYKLLPTRQENKDWQKPLETIIEQLAGMQKLLLKDEQLSFLVLLSKLQGMFTLLKDNDFALYRRTIFECLSLLGEIKANV